MMFDSVREELALKISPLPKSTRLEKKTVEEKAETVETPMSPAVQRPVPPMPPVQPQTALHSPPLAPKTVQPPVQQSPVMQTFAPQPQVQQTAIEKPVEQSAPKTVERIETSEIMAKPTSPTLVEFRNKNTTIPEWRLQLQNAVRKRAERIQQTQAVSSVQTAVPRPLTTTQGATALKIEPTVQEEPLTIKNPTLANALRRIEESRKQFYSGEKPKLVPVPPPPTPAKNYPFTVVNSPSEDLAETSKAEEQKPVKFDTNKLPPISEVLEKSPSVRPATFPIPKEETFDGEMIEEDETTVAVHEEEEEEFDDCAPIAMRFNAGLFDLIIGSFASFILLLPFVVLSGNFFTIEGFFAFLVTTAIVMFIYLTTSVAFFGRTLGMRLFSLEIIDVEENDYPTFHQAAVNSVVYLISLALGGLGFVPAFFNDERRAAHDLAAGTIVVREY